MTAREEFQAELVTLLVEILSTLQDVRTELRRLSVELVESVHEDVSRETRETTRPAFIPPMPQGPLPEATVMRSGDFIYVRQPLPGNHALLARIDGNGALIDLRVELPNGERATISEEEAVRVFGPLRLPLTPQPATHPADRSLNPEQP